MRKSLHYIALFILSLLILGNTACQPTPDHEAVVAPSGYEEAILDQQIKTEKTDSTLPPTHWNEVLKLNYWDITIDADVFPNVSGSMPVYESRFVYLDDIRDQSDKVKRGLLKNATAYSEDILTKADYYRQIQLFADTPAWDDETGGYTRYRSEKEIKSYTEDLLPFIDSAPNELVYHPFSPINDSFPDNANYMLSDGSLAWMNCSSNSILIRYGSDIFINAIDQPESLVLQGDAYLGEPIGTQILGVAIGEQTARDQALSLMTQLSLDGFKIAKVEKARYIDDYSHSIITVGYQIVLCRAEGDYESAGDTISRKLFDIQNQTNDAAYRPNWFQEQVFIFVDETGIRSFFWIDPTMKPQLVNKNVAILPFDEVQVAIKTHLKNCFSWEENEEVFKEWYSGRSKYLVDHVGLYFGMIPKKNDVYAFYYGPVWIVTVRTYPADADVPALPYNMYTQYLHINAIDGSLISY